MPIQADQVTNGVLTPTQAATAAAGEISVQSAAVGTAASFARSDHAHSVSTGTPGAVEAGASAAEGSATSLARSDHAHSLASATPAAAGASNAAGSASSVSRSDHVHALQRDEDELDSTTTETSLTLSNTPLSAQHLLVWRNGVLMRRVASGPTGSDEYTWSGTTVTFNASGTSDWYYAQYAY